MGKTVQCLFINILINLFRVIKNILKQTRNFKHDGTIYFTLSYQSHLSFSLSFHFIKHINSLCTFHFLAYLWLSVDYSVLSVELLCWCSLWWVTLLVWMSGVTGVLSRPTPASCCPNRQRRYRARPHWGRGIHSHTTPSCPSSATPGSPTKQQACQGKSDKKG